MSARKVANTVELLENIFMFLPEGKLLRISAVCRLFRDSVHSSPKLQQRLWKYDDVKKGWSKAETPDGTYVANVENIC